jgi:hypothetical protein
MSICNVPPVATLSFDFCGLQQRSTATGARIGLRQQRQAAGLQPQRLRAPSAQQGTSHMCNRPPPARPSVAPCIELPLCGPARRHAATRRGRTCGCTLDDGVAGSPTPWDLIGKLDMLSGQSAAFHHDELGDHRRRRRADPGRPAHDRGQSPDRPARRHAGWLPRDRPRRQARQRFILIRIHTRTRRRTQGAVPTRSHEPL